MLLLAATTTLPERFTGFGAVALTPLPGIVVGDALGSCMFNLDTGAMDVVYADAVWFVYLMRS